MEKDENKMLENYKARIKKQNEKIKESYDRVSATLPKGTVDRIKVLGLTINGVINESVLAYLDCMEEVEADEDAQRDDISPKTGETVKYTPTHKNTVTEPQNASESPYDLIPERFSGFYHMPPEDREKWENVQSVEELQAMLEAKREDMKRQQEERDQAKADALEQERKENLSIMMSAIDNAMNAQKQREKSDEEELERMEENGDDFQKYSEENIKEVLRVNGSFREHVSSHVYKDAMIEKYGASNYALFQKCLQDVESEEKEAKRQETIVRAKTEINQ